jgi:protein AroM
MKPARTVGLVTIGQAPRPDLMEEYEHAFSGARFLQVGALDDLSDAEILDLAPGDADEVLVSRLRSGIAVRLARRHLEPRLQRCLDRLAPEADLTILLCTGEFPALRLRGPVLVPRRALYHVVAAVTDGLRPSGDRALSVLIPDAAQGPSAQARWAGLGRPTTVAVSPYRWQEEIEAVGAALAQTRPDVVVMDCIGYTRAMRRLVARLTNAPVILANAAVATVAREVIGEADDAHGA